MEIPEIKARAKDDPEYNEIRELGFGIGFVEYMKDKDLSDIRLPLNNPEAYQYLCWVNEHFATDTTFLNFLLNIFDAGFKPLTAREHAVMNVKLMADYAKDMDKDGDEGKEAKWHFDLCAEAIQNAYAYWSYPQWGDVGLAGCLLKWGTWEDNENPGDEAKYAKYE